MTEAKRGFQLALADASELRAEWTRGLGAELRAAGCSDRVLAAAVAHPADYHVVAEDTPERLPKQAAPRARPRSTFFVDNTRCSDRGRRVGRRGAVGQVAPGRRSAWSPMPASARYACSARAPRNVVIAAQCARCSCTTAGASRCTA